MGKRTSLYLSDDLAAAVEQAGLPLAELVRRGIYGPPVRPVVVPIRPEVPHPPAAVVASPAGGGDARAAEVPQAAPAGDAGEPAASAPDAGERWRCGDCHWLQAIGSVAYCEFCGRARSRDGAA